MRLFWAFAGALVIVTLSARADSLHFSGGKKWLVLASTQNVDQAVGIARRVRADAQTARVVRAVNGYYAIIAGPYASSTIVQFKATKPAQEFSVLPRDALLSDGARYVETVWNPSGDSSLHSQAYALGKPVILSAGAFSAVVVAEKLGADNAYTKITGRDDKASFSFDIGKDVPVTEQESAETMMGDNYFRAAAVKLIEGSETPQLVVTHFTGGTHCCTETYIIGREPGSDGFSFITAGARDGEGFAYDDIDGDGVKEMFSVDNAFYYAFDSYAGSMAPIQIYKVKAGKLEDVSSEPVMHARLVQDLASMEWEAKLSPEIAKTNGYLAGWVASKIRLGEGDAAWKVFMRDYDRHSDFGPQECLTGQTIDDCPDGNLKAIPIPRALAAFLAQNGYIPIPAAALAEMK